MDAINNQKDELTEKEVTPLLIGVGKNVKDTKLKNEYFSVDGFVKNLMKHKAVSAKNNTPVFLQGSLIKDGGSKDKGNIKNVMLFCIDIDNKEYGAGEDGYVSYDQAVRLVNESGLQAVIYTTYSHSEDKDKLRVVFPMKELYALDTDNNKEKWASFYIAILDRLGFKNVDETGERWTQVFFFPSHPKDKNKAKLAWAEHINPDGEMLDWRDYQDAATAAAIVTNIAKLSSKERREYIYEGLDLRIWVKVYGSTFQIADALKAGKHDVIGPDADNGKAVCLQPCPFEDEHSTKNPAPNRTVIYNPDGKGGEFGFECKGEHCHNRDRLAYVEKMLIDGWLTLDDLQNDKFGGGSLDALAMAKKCDEQTSPKKIKMILKVASVVGGATVEIPARKELERQTRWRISDLNALIKENEHEQKAKDAVRKEKEKKEAERRISPALNKEFAIVQLGNSVRILREKKENVAYLSKSDFMTLTQATFINIGDLDVAVAPLWLTSPGRREYDEVIFLPYAPNEKPAEKPRQYNLWKGFAVKPDEGDWGLLKRHILDNVCCGDVGYYQWFIGWLAQMVQEPTVKMGTSIVMKGEKGTGKSKVSDWVRKMCGKHGVLISDQHHLTGNFNSHLEACLFLQAEEATYGGAKKDSSVLKNLITSEIIPVERKGIDTVNMPNYTRVMSTSNEKWIVPATEDERRFFVLEVGKDQKQNGAYFAAIDAQMLGGGLEAMLYDLMHYDYSNLDLRNPPRTAALADQVEQGLEVNARWLLDALSEGGISGDYSHTEYWKDFSRASSTPVPKEIVYENYIEFAKRQILRPDSRMLLGKFLADKAVGQKRLTQKKVRHYVFPPLGEMRQAFTAEYGIEIKESGALAFALKVSRFVTFATLAPNE